MRSEQLAGLTARHVDHSKTVCQTTTGRIVNTTMPCCTDTGNFCRQPSYLCIRVVVCYHGRRHSANIMYTSILLTLHLNDNTLLSKRTACVITAQNPIRNFHDGRPARMIGICWVSLVSGHVRIHVVHLWFTRRRHWGIDFGWWENVSYPSTLRQCQAHSMQVVLFSLSLCVCTWALVRFQLINLPSVSVDIVKHVDMSISLSQWRCTMCAGVSWQC